MRRPQRAGTMVAIGLAVLLASCGCASPGTSQPAKPSAEATAATGSGAPGQSPAAGTVLDPAAVMALIPADEADSGRLGVWAEQEALRLLREQVGVGSLTQADLDAIDTARSDALRALMDELAPPSPDASPEGSRPSAAAELASWRDTGSGGARPAPESIESALGSAPTLAGLMGDRLTTSKTSTTTPDAVSGSKTEETPLGTVTTAGDIHFEGSEIVGELTVSTDLATGGKTYNDVVVVKARGDVCPKADGTLSYTFEQSQAVSGGAGEGTATLQGSLDAQVGDDAFLKRVDMSATNTMTGGGRSASASARWTSTATTGTGIVESAMPKVSLDGVDNMTATAGSGTERGAGEFLAVLTWVQVKLFAERLLSYAQETWRNGGCVVLEVPEGTRANVKPNEVKSFTTTVRQKWEGVDVPAPVTAKLLGKKTVEPNRIEAAPGTFTVTMGPDEYATIKLETVSRRGRDTEDVVYWVRAAYRVQGGADDLVVDQVVCDVTRTFDLSGSGITLTFYPDLNDSSGGTYEYKGDFGEFTAQGEGTYRIKLTDAGGTIDAEGKGSITSEMGTFSSFGKEHYDLTPAECP